MLLLGGCDSDSTILEKHGLNLAKKEIAFKSSVGTFCLCCVAEAPINTNMSYTDLLMGELYP